MYFSLLVIDIDSGFTFNFFDLAMFISEFRIFLWTLEGLMKAWLYLRRGMPAGLSLPQIRTASQLSEKDLDGTVRVIDSIVRMMLPRTRHGCFYRTLSRTIVLRKLGVPVAVNIGLRNLDGTLTVKGHCWLSLNGMPFQEPPDTTAMYPFFLGKLENGLLCWVQKGNDRSNRIRRIPAQDTASFVRRWSKRREHAVSNGDCFTADG
ncbi:MAG: lasso peptide biosynthesis protein [Syntrophotaleaceae bacterium]